MKAVADSSVLIYMARLGLLASLARLYDEVLVPSSVHHEVVERGDALGKPDAAAVKRALAEGTLRSAGKNVRALPLPASLGPGERQVIALTLDEQAEPLIDDREAHLAARVFGLHPRRTTALLFQGVIEGLWTPHQFEGYLQTLSREGYFITADIYHFLVDQAHGRARPERRGS